MNSLSKNMGLSGWRIGYCLAHREVIAQLLKVNQHLITCAPTILQNYLARHFHEILDATIPQARQMAVKRSKVKDILDKIGIRYLEGGGTFYFMLDMASFKGSTDELVLDLLLNENIALVSGRAYGDSVKDFVRFGIGIESLGNIEKSLKVIKSYLDRPSYDNSALMRQLKKENITLDAV